jgi:hypothetical protein
MFWIDIYERVKLWAAEADEAGGSRWLVYDGDPTDPGAWESLLREVGCVEHFNVHIPHADKLRHLWTQWLAERKRRRDERGW